MIRSTSIKTLEYKNLEMILIEVGIDSYKNKDWHMSRLLNSDKLMIMICSYFLVDVWL